MAKTKKDLILVMASTGSTDTVMDAAKKAGARGGTVLRGHRVKDSKEKPGDETVHPEKEIIAILVPRELRQPVMGCDQQRGRYRYRVPGRSAVSAGG